MAFGAATGYSGAMMNPFTVGIAQGIAEVAPMSGTGYRFLCHMVLLEVGSALTIRYALKVQDDPSKSLVYGETGHITMSEDDVQNSPLRHSGKAGPAHPAGRVPGYRRAGLPVWRRSLPGPPPYSAKSGPRFGVCQTEGRFSFRPFCAYMTCAMKLPMICAASTVVC